MLRNLRGPGRIRFFPVRARSEKDSTQIDENKTFWAVSRAISEKFVRPALTAITRPRVVQNIKSTPRPPHFVEVRR